VQDGAAIAAGIRVGNGLAANPPPQQVRQKSWTHVGLFWDRADLPFRSTCIFGYANELFWEFCKKC
jgi:hypothetical protein